MGKKGFVDDPFALEVATPPTTGDLEVILEDEEGPDGSDKEETSDDAIQETQAQWTLKEIAPWA